ncbi:MAG TPA: aspartate kinase [Thermoleophilia bacterium]|nr:aspartate kinase [Thermoleophilia bacterium]
MSVVVQKYGGTSVADAARIGNVARRIVATFEQGHSVCAVVSARGDTTDELLALAREITPDPPEREMDMLLSAGERISCALLAMAIHRLGYDAVSYTGSQAGIITDTTHTKARILDIHPDRIESAMREGKIVLVAGFQGVSTAKDVTTLGRGGSDTTAVALAHALGAVVCETYTDVDGVYTANPSLVSRARKLDHVSYDEMLEMAASGAQVLALRSVEYARKFDIPIHVRSSFSEAEGTWVNDGGHGMDIEQQLEQPIIRAISYTTDEAKVTLRGVPDKPGVAARVFNALAAARVNVDTIIQNTSESGHSDISCTVPVEDLPAAELALHDVVEQLGAREYVTDSSIAKISLIGAGMRSHPGVAATMFQTLADLGINLDMIGTSPIKISCVIAKEHVDEAVRTLHTAFDLDEKDVVHEASDRGVC